jgi:pimeloyl-ACP methyl ester carboxylesterase
MKMGTRLAKSRYIGEERDLPNRATFRGQGRMLLAELIFLWVLVFVVLRPVYSAYLFTHPLRIRVSFRTPADLGVTYDNVTITSSDGVRLSGWYIPSRNGAAVILLHGHSGNRLAVMFHAEALVKAGYGVLMFDLRAHGSSGGRIFSRGQNAPDDVLAAVAYLSKRPDVKPGGIGAMGVSVGGLLALQAAARTVAIRAVAGDGISPATMRDMPPPQSFLDRFWYLPWQRYFMRAIGWFARTPELPANVDILPRLAPRPVLFIAAGGGEGRLAQHYYEAAGEPKMLWRIPNATHANGWRVRPEEYGHKIVTFFNQALLRSQERPVTAAEQGEAEASTAAGAEADEPTRLATANVAYEATISMGRANAIALLVLPLAFVFLLLPYRLLWGSADVNAMLTLTPPSLLLLLLGLALGIGGHELLHAAAFVLVGKAPLSAVRFGFSWKAFAPYAHCRAPLTAAAYRVALLLPGLALGIVPGFLGVIGGSLPLALWGILMLVAAGGDVAVWWAVRSVPAKALVLDHPTKAGCQVLQEKLL